MIVTMMGPGKTATMLIKTRLAEKVRVNQMRIHLSNFPDKLPCFTSRIFIMAKIFM